MSEPTELTPQTPEELGFDSDEMLRMDALVEEIKVIRRTRHSFAANDDIAVVVLHHEDGDRTLTDEDDPLAYIVALAKEIKSIPNTIVPTPEKFWQRIDTEDIFLGLRGRLQEDKVLRAALTGQVSDIFNGIPVEEADSVFTDNEFAVPFSEHAKNKKRGRRVRGTLAAVVVAGLVAAACAKEITSGGDDESTTTSTTTTSTTSVASTAPSINITTTTSNVPEVCPEMQPDGSRTFLTKPGDSLSKIATLCGVTPAELLALNPSIIDPNLIPLDVELIVSAPSTTTTMAPETNAPLETAPADTAPPDTAAPAEEPVATSPPQTAPPATAAPSAPVGPRDGEMSAEQCAALGGTQMRFEVNQYLGATLKSLFGLDSKQALTIVNNTNIMNTYRLGEITASSDGEVWLECMPSASTIQQNAGAPAPAPAG